MKQGHDYAVYATDSDGSERKAVTIFGTKSVGHARKLAMEKHGVRKITDIVMIEG